MTTIRRLYNKNYYISVDDLDFILSQEQPRYYEVNAIAEFPNTVIGYGSNLLVCLEIINHYLDDKQEEVVF